MKKKRHSSRHHVIPSSRGGRTEPDNIATVNSKAHKYYHALFQNMLPSEILTYLNRGFWNSQFVIQMTKREVKDGWII